jgi:carbamoyl-phosphate synthase large subunit
MIKNGEINMVINTTEGKAAVMDSYSIRREALNKNVTYTTTVAGGEAICAALYSQSQVGSGITVYRLQQLHEGWV